MSDAIIAEPRNALLKGGSSLLQVGLSDAVADQIWAERYAHTITDITSSAVVIGTDRATDYPLGKKVRLRNTSSNDGVVTIAAQPTWDDNNGELSITVEESLTSESPTDAVIEPLWLRGGWHTIAKHLEGGDITEQREGSVVKDEFGREVGEVISDQEVVISNTLFANTERAYKLIKYLEGAFVEGRYPLPLTQAGTFETIGGDRYADMRLYPRLTARAQDREETIADDEQRSLPFEVVASLSQEGSGAAYAYREQLNLDTQSGWPSKYDPWKDAAYTSTRATS
jgi:hypothetical protein